MTKQGKVILVVMTGFLFLSGMVSRAQQTKRPFTVTDEIGLTLFTPPSSVGVAPEVRFSPNRHYFVVWTERGRLDLNCVEDSLRIYATHDVENFLRRSDASESPSPVWVVDRSGKEGPVIKEWHWLPDSSGVAFVEATAGGNQQLILADLSKKMLQPLTSATETVKAFDVRDRNHYVYTVADLAERNKRQTEPQAPATVGTGRTIYELIRPDDRFVTQFISPPSNILWAVVGERRVEVRHDGAPIIPYGNLALSSDGRSLVTALPVPQVPSSWETLYPPSFESNPRRIRAGGSAHQYVRINLDTGSVQNLTDAPLSSDADWWVSGNASPNWSSDGTAILLPGTFLKSTENVPSRPCVAIVDLPSNTVTCVEMLKGHTGPAYNDVEEGYHTIRDVRFAHGNRQQVMVSFYNPLDASYATTEEYQHTNRGTWRLVRTLHLASQFMLEPDVEHDGLEVAVKQDLNEPQRLVATSKQGSRVIWDPNLQLGNFELGESTVYTWKDSEGRNWEGGLYKPGNYKRGQHYPLVIQTHGFAKSYFVPSGFFPTAFAARALAAVGIVVLQVTEAPCHQVTLDEAPCAVTGYEAGARQLVAEGLVDPKKIGIIGFSRSCLYVMEAITFGSLHFEAALIADGVMLDYFQYIVNPERVSQESNLMIGAEPFGEGLQLWVKLSTGFNLDRINTPLLINTGEGIWGVLNMWEPYAGLHYLRKPVDLIILNTQEHVLTNPAVRLASQGGSVDWFRFWLQDYEDPDPAKAEQYKRWEGLRQLKTKPKR